MEKGGCEEKQDGKDRHNGSEFIIKNSIEFFCWENASIEYCISAITCYTVPHQLKRRMNETVKALFSFLWP